MPASPAPALGGRARCTARFALLIVVACLALVPAAQRAAAAGTAPSTVAIWKIYPPGWNLVAGPGGSRLGLHNETLYSLNGAVPAYTAAQAPAAHAGEGYWVYYPHGAMLLLIGVPQGVSSVHVTGGNWALIGNSGTMPASVRGADIALTYDPDAGFAPAGRIQPGQAALVYAYTDADVFIDPYSPVSSPATIAPRSQPPQAVPSLPNAGNGAASPTDELNYLYTLNPLLADVEQQLSDFADNIGFADPGQPSAPVWTTLQGDASQVHSDLTQLQALTAPARYTQVQADLVAALSDIGDGMTNTIAGLLNGQPDRVTLGAGLLQSGARRLTTARASLPQ